MEYRYAQYAYGRATWKAQRLSWFGLYSLTIARERWRGFKSGRTYSTLYRNVTAIRLSASEVYLSRYRSAVSTQRDHLKSTVTDGVRVLSPVARRAM